MPTGQPLKSIEEEAALENAGGILGLIALILAVLALLLILMGKRGGGPEATVAPQMEEIIVDPVLEDDFSSSPEPEPLPAPVPPEFQEEDPGNRPLTHQR
jgi:hypothetical protein